MEGNTSIDGGNMKTQHLAISNIPCIIWGEKSDKLIIAVHGNMSSKSDFPYVILAEEAVALGYQVLSFDLPEHGDRKNEPTLCKVEICVSEFKSIMEYAKSHTNHISLMANSMGAYFSLLAFTEEPLKQSLFLSPVVDMERIISNMMKWFDVSEERLRREKEIATPIGHTLYWDYYLYVKGHPITKWESPTRILYGNRDDLCERDYIMAFAEKFHSKVDISSQSEHYFHTEEDMKIYRQWVRDNLANNHNL